MKRFELGPEDILTQMQIPDHWNWFALGMFDVRVTMYSQQIKAVNLAYALVKQHRMIKCKSVAVIGAGVTGLTFAKVASLHGCSVALFEKLDMLVPIQRHTTRWVHPHIYNWPERNSHATKTDLPILNWEADFGGEVTDRMLNEWNRDKPTRKGALKEHLNIKHITVTEQPEGFRTRVNWTTKDGLSGFEKFDIVVFAVGFGSERNKFGIEVIPYWANENLNQVELRNGGKYTVLVSGTGDGGLIDVLRIRLNDFKHANIVDEFLSGNLRELMAKLTQIETDAVAQRHPDEWLSGEYLKLKCKQVADALKSKLREHIEVTLNGQSPWPLTMRSSILHRFLVAQLIQIGAIAYIPGTIENIWKDNDIYHVRFAGVGNEVQFSRIVLRHGAESDLEKDFPVLYKHRERLRTFGEKAQSRWPIWDDEFCK